MIARVSLEIALRKEFDYLIPPGLAGQIEVGSRVQVPFGPRKIFGCVTALAEESAHANLKPILKVIGAQTLVTPKVLKLARWIADYYCCAPEIALKSVLPEAVRKEKSGWRERLFVRALPVAGEFPKLPKRQQEVWNIIEERREMPLTELLELAETTAATVRKLEDRGLVEIATQISERDPYAREHILPSQPLPLNPAQAPALEKITMAMDGREVEVEEQRALELLQPASIFHLPSSTFLLHGVTGSGKTEIYLQALAHALEQGKGAIVLVPEISLTPQTVERFKARFSSGRLQTLVAVLHSHLSAGERHDEWHKIRQGRARIVIGARSAIFAPVEPLGLIIVDEEHEHSYKQEEAPRYHARDVAIMRGQMENAVVVLGSATPSLESYYNCKQRQIHPARTAGARGQSKNAARARRGHAPGRARRKGHPDFFAATQGSHHATARTRRTDDFVPEPARLFLFAAMSAGAVMWRSAPIAASRSPIIGRNRICAAISAVLWTPVPAVCPNEKCRNPGIRYAGLGTQKVEETLAKLFPHARVRRMDSDTMKRKDDYRKTLGDFRAGKTDILVGTQMIAKGLHFPNVTLVGIIYADMALHQPDFRAGERTFQLLTQVAGRAGRGDVEGEVFVQAFTPFHPAIQFARRHDFVGFYEQEIEFREQLKYPPVSRVALLTLKGRNEDKVKFSAEHLKHVIESAIFSPQSTVHSPRSNVSGTEDCGLKTGDLIIAGPAPAPLLRAETFYRYQIMLRTRQMTKLSQRLSQIIQPLALPEDVMLSVDIDPVDLA